jgi:hypothetical protein
MQLELTPGQEQAREQAAAFARELVAPAAADIDATGEFPVALLREAASRGYLGMLMPGEFGGLGLDHVSYALAIEAIARASATMAVILAVHNSLVIEAIAQSGSTAQKERWLQRLATGGLLGRSRSRRPMPGPTRRTSRRRRFVVGQLPSRRTQGVGGQRRACGHRARLCRHRARRAHAACRPSSSRSTEAGIRREPGVDSLGVRVSVAWTSC